MIAKIALVFAGFIVWGVVTNLILLVLGFFTIFILGMGPKTVQVQFWICAVPGLYITYRLLRPGWPKPAKPREPNEPSAHP